mmetsp:Transcript_2649/g.7410  ORF Transcript_2649/g.7410 Transcript_2649/m.7410 type:complete len:281 (-) Transcript_2649:812-1654(-)
MARELVILNGGARLVTDDDAKALIVMELVSANHALCLVPESDGWPAVPPQLVVLHGGPGGVAHQDAVAVVAFQEVGPHQRRGLVPGGDRRALAAPGGRGGPVRRCHGLLHGLHSLRPGRCRCSSCLRHRGRVGGSGLDLGLGSRHRCARGLRPPGGPQRADLHVDAPLLRGRAAALPVVAQAVALERGPCLPTYDDAEAKVCLHDVASQHSRDLAPEHDGRHRVATEGVRLDEGARLLAQLDPAALVALQHVCLHHAASAVTEHDGGHPGTGHCVVLHLS